MAAVIALAASPAKPTSAAEAQRVLLLHAFGHPFSPWSDMAAAFRAALTAIAPNAINFYEVSLDTSRVRDFDDEKPFVAYMHALVSEQKLDLLVPVGTPATLFVKRNFDGLFPDSPALVLGADARLLADVGLAANEIAVQTKVDIPIYVENILRLRPDTTEIAVVVGNSPIEQYWATQLRHELARFGTRVKFDWFNDLAFDQMLERAAHMPANAAILWFMLVEDAAGVPYSQDHALALMRQVSAVPLFGIGDYEFGRGIVGGPLYPTATLGQNAAKVAARILKGEAVSNIEPPETSIGVPVYDWRELRRWGIDEDKLPRGSIVRFREPGLWEQYRWQIVAIVTVLCSQTLLIGYVLIQNRKRRAAEAEAMERRQQATHLMRVSVLGELSGAIAHELNQPLTAILSNAQASLHVLDQSAPDLTEVREAVCDIIREDNRASAVIERLRKLLQKGERKIEKVDLNDLVLSTAALLHTELLRRRIEVEIDLADRLPETTGDPVQLQQVLLNLFINAMDAMASTPIALRYLTASTRVTETGYIEVRIRDHGTGIGAVDEGQLFAPFYTSKDNGLGLGLSICSTIARAHGAKLTLSNHDDRGAVAVLSVPVRESAVWAR